MLEKTLESPLDYKEVKPVHPKGNEAWVFTGRTDVETETPGGRREEGSGWGTHVYLWRIHFDIWQN